MRTGSASHLVVYAVTGVGGLALAAVSVEATPVSADDSILIQWSLIGVLAGIGIAGRVLFGLRDDMRDFRTAMFDQRTGFAVTLDKLAGRVDTLETRFDRAHGPEE